MSDGRKNPRSLRHHLSCKHLTGKFHHSVYVILLEPAVAEHPSILRRNPNRDPAKPCLYVGMTGLPVEHRFENHKNGPRRERSKQVGCMRWLGKREFNHSVVTHKSYSELRNPETRSKTFAGCSKIRP